MNVQKILPDPIQNNLDPGWLALAAETQAIVDFNEGWIFRLAQIDDPLKCPYNLLVELGYLIAAQIREQDSDRTRRVKIATAIQGHRRRGIWNDDLKLRIDAITEKDARLFAVSDNDDDIILCNPADGSWIKHWGTWQCLNGVDDMNGMNMICFTIDSIYYITGNIAVNCHYGITTPILTADQIAQIVNDIQFDFAPAYLKIYLGYVNGSGQFIPYAGGVI